jgi:transcriptional regulator with XRE-family HTH domain
MFQIGPSLREARERRGLSYADVERVTHIRARHLRALEEEEFELLPGRTYAREFLREYTDFLGLREQHFLDEFSSRFPPEEEANSLVPLQPIRRRRLRFPAARLAVAAAALLVITLTVWLVGIGGTAKHAQRRRLHHPTARRQLSPPPSPSLPPPPRPRVAKLTLSAATGACWLDAHVGSSTGPTLQTGMLDAGQSAHLRGKRIWIRLGAPTVLTAMLNGKRVQLPQTTPVDVLVTPAGIRTVA